MDDSENGEGWGEVRGMTIDSKAEFYRLWRLGVLGNSNQLFNSLPDALASKCQRIGFRQIGKAGGGKWEDCPREQATDVAIRWTAEGRRYILDGGAPSKQSTLIGEICRTFRGVEGFLGLSTLPMRPAITAGHLTPRSYAETNALLDAYMDPSSRDDVRDLLDLYPDATIEFSCFSRDFGMIPGRNTIIWEVRNY